jgi:hypothetical protein
MYKIHFNIIFHLSLDKKTLKKEERYAYSVFVGETWRIETTGKT